MRKALLLALCWPLRRPTPSLPLIADKDKDGTVSRDEYLAAVEAAFRAADKDNEGTLDKKALRSPAGRKLEALLK